MVVEMYWSGRADLNGRPPAPKAGALTRLRYAPTPKIPIAKYQAPNKFRLPIHQMTKTDASDPVIALLFNTSVLQRQPPKIT